MIQRVPAYLTDRLVNSTNVLTKVMRGEMLKDDESKKVLESYYDIIVASIVEPKEAKNKEFVSQLDNGIIRVLLQAIVEINVLDVSRKKMANF